MPQMEKAAGRGGRDGAVAAASVLAGLAFSAVVFSIRGSAATQQYLAAYLVELSLSIDNVFVFALVFSRFGIGVPRQRRLLFWGIAGALVFRTALLVAGVGAIARFSWLVPVLGAVILATGIRFGIKGRAAQAPDPSRGFAGFAARHAPAGLAALVVLEATDLVFALDSLPAVLAVTHDAFVAVSSNILAILGLRSIFFLVQGAMRRARFLGAGLSAILCLVGLKMLAEPWIQVPPWAMLAAVAAVIALTGAASAHEARKGKGPASSAGGRP